MCITEVWTYHECGCHYNHSILCRSFRRNRSPCFAPNIQYSLEEWQQQTAAHDRTTIQEWARRGRPSEPQNCPYHAFVQRAFLNKICDDCLLQELDMQPLSIADELPHQAEPNNGEGLIWDSEVNVQVDEMQFEMLSTPTKDGKSVPTVDTEDDRDKRILESHVEVKIDFESSSVSGEPSSPLFPSSATRSYPSSLEASPPASTYRTKRFGFALPEGVTYDLDTADDDSDDYPEIYDWTSSPLFRGRSLTRKKLTSFEIYGVSPDGSDTSVKGKSLSRLKSLKTMSSNLRSVSSTKIPDKPVKVDVAPADKPRTLLRGLRSRKSSPLLTTKRVSSQIAESQCSGSYGNLEPKATKKSGLRNWAKFMIPEKKRSKHVPIGQLRNQTRSCAPSPTGSWTRAQEDSHEEMPILTSNLGNVAPGGCRISSSSKDVEKGDVLEADNKRFSGSAELPAEMVSAADQIQLVEDDIHQDDHDEKTMNDLTMPQNREVVQPANTGEASNQQTADEPEIVEDDVKSESPVQVELLTEEKKMEESLVAKDMIETKASGEPNIDTQPEQTTDEAIVANYASESGGCQDETPAEKEDWTSREIARPGEALPERQEKQDITPRSSFLQSIIESNNVKPHPPRKSSLRQIMAQSKNASSVPKFSFPLPRSVSNKTPAEGGRGLLLENPHEF